MFWCIDVYCVSEHFKICHNLKSNTLIFGVWGNRTLYSKSYLSLQSKGSVVKKLPTDLPKIVRHGLFSYKQALLLKSP